MNVAGFAIWARHASPRPALTGALIPTDTARAIFGQALAGGTT